MASEKLVAGLESEKFFSAGGRAPTPLLALITLFALAGLLSLQVLLPESRVAAQSVQGEALPLANGWQNYARTPDFTPAEVLRQGHVCKLAGLIDKGYRAALLEFSLRRVYV